MRLIRISCVSSDRLNLHFDHSPTLVVSPLTVSSLNLFRNMEITPDLYRRIYIKSLSYLAYLYCLRLIALSSQAKPIIKQKLIRFFYLQGHKSNHPLKLSSRDRLINRIIKRLEKAKLIDDRQYILDFISRKKNLSHYQLNARLIFLGFDHALVNSVLAGQQNQEKDKIMLLLQKKFPSFRNQIPNRIDRQKIFSYLSRRFFDYDQINSAVDEFTKKK